MEGFNPLRFKWLLGEHLVDKNIDPRGISGVELTRDLEFLRFNLVVTYRILTPDGPQEWSISKVITHAEAAEIEDMEYWMEEESRFVAQQIQRILIPNRTEWFEYLTELLDELREQERENGLQRILRNG
jgi:hypothetical protein